MPLIRWYLTWGSFTPERQDNMKVSELIDFLTHDVKGDPDVLVSSDAEGNEFHGTQYGLGFENTLDGLPVIVIWASHDNIELE
jgi:hypothetical protein